MAMTLRLALACTGLMLAAGVQAHGGGLNADGCHVNRKTGDYHCHRPPAKAMGSAGAHAGALQPAPTQVGLRTAARGAGSFANCAQARAAGAAPVHIGEPGYGAHLDRDGDGIGCEPYRPRR
ncbi:excalibur calcium-binding domain-containing protein [Massilia aurea]|uniref:excalibur calcium-binding domain-containing protein n=1 Tax=Massilia aurea TaxID=373040 RepID=UPI003461C390